jgi:hypothetical protein
MYFKKKALAFLRRIGYEKVDEEIVLRKYRKYCGTVVILVKMVVS